MCLYNRHAYVYCYLYLFIWLCNCKMCMLVHDYNKKILCAWLYFRIMYAQLSLQDRPLFTLQNLYYYHMFFLVWRDFKSLQIDMFLFYQCKSIYMLLETNKKQLVVTIDTMNTTTLVPNMYVWPSLYGDDISFN